jgi:hypothetical protein
MVVNQAREAVERYFAAFNKKDSELVSKTLHYPHFRIDPEGRIKIAMNELDAKTSHDWIFDKLIQRDEWSYSRLESIEVVHESSVKVHFKLIFSRYRADDSKISESNSLWIITLRDGEWRVLARSSYAS